ncbi:hypothetical protein LL037_12770 [Clostridium estertheticum]|uniref:tetratricopeptide repeat protein n=1 Tax=Clostridium estertheticum TaxID=238834 RepID=UPI001C0D5636|nr:hypothetical protein [Clostridium estertheticum]MBU3200946.1 hypothetical protein [Clostridium estertheticum]WAG63368.1 hypothetical protein LL037_12770 [Clostridium estertheticum]
MDKNIVKNTSIISVIVVIVVVCGGFGIYKYSKTQTYNNLITTANKDMDQGEYEQAIALFNQSLQYKDDSNVKNNVKLATNLKEVKSILDQGIKLMNDKKYLDAIEQFKKVTKEDNKLYDNAQKGIEECKKQYIAQNIKLATDAIKDTKYDEATKYLEGILKLDSNNADAKKLKENMGKTIQKQKDEVEAKEKVTTSIISTKGEELQVYNNLLNDIKWQKNNGIIFSDGKSTIDEHYFVDIDQDGVYEMLLHHGSCEADLTVSVVTYNNRNVKVQKLPSDHGGYAGYSKSTKVFFLGGSTQGHSITKGYKLENGSCKQVYECTDDAGVNLENATYNVNGQKVPKEEYDRNFAAFGNIVR